MNIELKEDIRHLASFSMKSGEKIGKRDHWNCKGPGDGQPCILVPVLGKPANFFDGYMVQKSHIERGGNDPSNGEIRCITCHWWSHKMAGEDDFASLIEESDILTRKARRAPRDYPLAITSLKGIFDVIELSEANMFKLGLRDLYEAESYFKRHPVLPVSPTNHGIIQLFR